MSHNNAPTLVLLPGMDGTGMLFEPFRACLGDDLRVQIIPYADQAGAGYDQLAEYVAPLLPPSPFILLGESFAGPLAILLAAKKPPGLRGLVLAATFARSPRPWARHLSSLVPLMFMSRAWAHASLPFLIGNRAPRALRQSYMEAVSGIGNAALRGRLAATLSVDVSSSLALTVVPLLCLRATRDVLVPQAATEHIHATRPDSILKAVDGPHGILQSNPQACADHVRDFIAANVCRKSVQRHQGLRNQ
ncbi:alpha/beta fold hydrolase [Luteibacter sp.]|uniref:alpha/beta fold hydrolase n=1 Tax=Luteibacter sp. TaxID=1886636 RepID=UPI003F815EFE